MCLLTRTDKIQNVQKHILDFKKSFVIKTGQIYIKKGYKCIVVATILITLAKTKLIWLFALKAGGVPLKKVIKKL